MKFGGRANKRSEIPSFREFINQEKILKESESGIKDDKESEYESIKINTPNTKEKSDKKNKNKKILNYSETQIKEFNIEKYKLIKENGLLKEEIENYRKSMVNKDFNKLSNNSKDEKIKKLEKEIMRLKSNESAKKESDTDKENYIPNGIVQTDFEEEKNKLNKIISELKAKIKEITEHKNKAEKSLTEIKSKFEENNKEKSGLNKTIEELKSKLEKGNKEKAIK